MSVVRALALICVMVWSSFSSAGGLRAFAVGAPPAGPCLQQTIVYEGTLAGGFSAVSAPSPNDIWALGQDGSKVPSIPLIVHGDGRHWQRIPYPTVRGQVLLNSISVLSDQDVWVAGVAWPSPTSNVVGVPVVARWDGVRWREVPGVDPAMRTITGIVAISAGDVWVVSAGQQRISHWDGRWWRAVDYPDSHAGDELEAIAAGSARDVWAVGRDWIGHSLTLHWDGRRWQHIPSPSAKNFEGGPLETHLDGVAVVAPDDAWAVGYSGDAVTPARDFSIHWDGVAWQAVPDAYRVPAGDQAVGVALTAVAAVSHNEVWAVGPILERWDGRRWQAGPEPQIGGDDGPQLAAPASGDLWTVGTDTDVPAIAHETVRPCPAR